MTNPSTVPAPRNRVLSHYGQPLARLAQALDDLICDEDLGDEKLREASEGLLPALADALHSRGAYSPETQCQHCKQVRGDFPSRGFYIDGNSPIVPDQRHMPTLYYSCEVCRP